ncbi:hypothetical protein VNI00_014184 [Paramarasmius palmivorus]|uniref:Uncharacterized protein n=1 Tax=Paramarasmius palmivorus TaxID=297713 RepID=A0AAW0BUA0_9AGAR
MFPSGFASSSAQSQGFPSQISVGFGTRNSGNLGQGSQDESRLSIIASADHLTLLQSGNPAFLNLQSKCIEIEAICRGQEATINTLLKQLERTAGAAPVSAPVPAPVSAATNSTPPHTSIIIPPDTPYYDAEDYEDIIWTASAWDAYCETMKNSGITMKWSDFLVDVDNEPMSKQQLKKISLTFSKACGELYFHRLEPKSAKYISEMALKYLNNVLMIEHEEFRLCDSPWKVRLLLKAKYPDFYEQTSKGSYSRLIKSPGIEKKRKTSDSSHAAAPASKKMKKKRAPPSSTEIIILDEDTTSDAPLPSDTNTAASPNSTVTTTPAAPASPSMTTATVVTSSSSPAASSGELSPDSSASAGPVNPSTPVRPSSTAIADVINDAPRHRCEDPLADLVIPPSTITLSSATSANPSTEAEPAHGSSQAANKTATSNQKTVKKTGKLEQVKPNCYTSRNMYLEEYIKKGNPVPTVVEFRAIWKAVTPDEEKKYKELGVEKKRQENEDSN